MCGKRSPCELNAQRGFQFKFIQVSTEWIKNRLSETCELRLSQLENKIQRQYECTQNINISLPNQSNENKIFSMFFVLTTEVWMTREKVHHLSSLCSFSSFSCRNWISVASWSSSSESDFLQKNMEYFVRSFFNSLQCKNR